MADRNRNIFVAEFLELSLKFAPACSRRRRGGTAQSAPPVWCETVDLAPLKTLFPQSITFDCCSTKGEVVNIRVRGGEGHDGKAAFAEVALPRAKNEKGKAEHQSYTTECLL